jgi:hypothetical protein
MKEINKIDSITMDVPLFIRMLEYAKEDAKTDMDLHSATERALELSKGGDMLDMSKYSHIVNQKKVDATEQTMSDSSGSFEAPLSNTPTIKRKVTTIHNTKQPEIDMKEATDASSSGAFDVPLFGSTKGRKDPLSIGGEKTIGQSRAVKDKNFPKWGGPGSVFVKIKDKCKKFPYCNQGDINAVEMLEMEELNEAIEITSKKHNIPRKHVETLVLNEIKKVIIEGNQELDFKLSGIVNKLNPYFEETPNEMTKKGLLKSMKMIGNGKIGFDSYSETFKYSEKLNDDLELVVYGNIGRPMMRRTYNYEIIIFRGNSFTTQYGGGFGSPGFIAKDRNRSFGYSTGNYICYNESTISELCNVVRNYFTQDK